MRMNRLLPLALLLPLFAIAQSATAANPTGAIYRYAVRYSMKEAADARPAARWLLKHDFDIAGLSLGKQEIEVITDDAGLALLAKNGFKGRVLERSFDGQMRAPDPRYWNPTTAAARLKELSEKYPNLTRLEQVGLSNQNRPVLALLVSTTPAKNDLRATAKPSVMIDGMHHAREVMTAEIAMDVAEHLLEGYASGDAEAKKIVDGWNVWVLPMLNVDGNNIVWTKNNMWRKNAAASGGTVHGVDINRNYPYRFADCNGSSGSRFSETYRGAAPASEPETKALMALADLAHPTASLSYHSYSELVLYPYGCDGALSGENALIEKVAKELASMLPSDGGSPNTTRFYTYGAPWQILYAVDGDSMDYVFSKFGALSSTFEVNQEFQPKYTLREPTLNKHRKAWKYFLNRASSNMLTLQVVDGATGGPLSAQIGINTIPHDQQEQPFQTNSSGTYFKVLDPGTYIITVKLANGSMKDVTVVMKGQPQQLVVEMK
jgi:carboxypeptidase T